MFVVEVQERRTIKSTTTLAPWLRALLQGLADADSRQRRVVTRGIEGKKWDFTFRSERLFLTIFAPFYEKNHPRYSESPRSAFVVFQGDFCFRSRGISGSMQNRVGLTHEVAACFLRRGYSYDLGLVTHPMKAARYLKPEDLSAGPVCWWMQ
jgi:hypothetical protein